MGMDEVIGGGGWDMVHRGHRRSFRKVTSQLGALLLRMRREERALESAGGASGRRPLVPQSRGL